jgi:hypothetical protein
LDAVDEVIEGFAGEVRVVGLREEGNDGDAGVATDDGDGLVGGIGVLDLGEKAGGADDVEGGDAEKTFGIIDALGLENFGADGNGRVDLGGGLVGFGVMVTEVGGEKREDKARKSMAYRVGNDEDVGVRCGVSASFGQITDNRGVGVEEICQLSVHQASSLS